MFNKNIILLGHIIEECNYLINNIYELDVNEYINNETFKRSSARSIEIIGEAVKSIDNNFKNKYSQVE